MTTATDTKSTLTLSDLGALVTIYRAVQQRSRVIWLPDGDESYSGKPCEGVARCFAHEGGGFLSDTEEVRDQYVHVSGIMETWLPVRDLIEWVKAGTFVVQ